ncbi:precorrin-3B synthase [Rhizobium sp. TRM95111]|uniref:precorrin-3B synthase n=1 Tax=Rhizobium alarense TaxID=2846851 RepID=UPI001F240756|nr:precorrin-3B synthase [Rhizobium alarense]MCF3640687.1 precorrin-3B synthase [Rhizobium alarense]
MSTTLFPALAAAPKSPLRRGACPSVAAPMPTGDGLLVRLRPQAAELSPAHWIAIAALAREHGNGLVEVTARGNLQVRGLSEETVAPFAAGLDAAGVAIRSGVAIEVPPLAGLDPSEIADATPLAERITRMIAAGRQALRLAPKLAVVVDGGGVLNLHDMVADIRLDAVHRAGEVRWRIAIAGDASSAAPIACLPGDAAADAVLRLLRELAALGPAARGRDLRAAGVPPFTDDGGDTVGRAKAPVGLLDIGNGPVLGLRLPYGKVHADQLEGLMHDLARRGARAVRLAPHRALLVLGIAAETAGDALRSAGQHGFWTDPDAPGNAISACAGSAGCAAARLDTHAVADALIAAAPGLFDGSAAIHVSGCTKGCAHPAAAPLTIVGTGDGAALVIAGRAGDDRASLAARDLPAALTGIGALVASEGRRGETARTLLERLGRDRLLSAFQGRT